MSILQEITKEQIQKAQAYDAIQIDLKDVQRPGEPVRECVLRLKYEALHLASMEARRDWVAERDARVGCDSIGTVPPTYVPEVSP